MDNRRSIISLIAVINCFLLIACSSQDSDEMGVALPSNLVINSKVMGISTQNPNGDGRGIVQFEISATNATSYKIDFGNGEIKDVADGNFEYTYAKSGTTSYVVQVSAYNDLKFITSSKSIKVYVASAPVWSDEFNIDGAPNTANWNYDIGAGGWGNNESQYYTDRPENIIVKGGLLRINTIKGNYNGSDYYTSARIQSKGKFSVRYGKIEFRAKMPVGGGTWPSLWMLGNNVDVVGWPFCGEIDIMEHLGNKLNNIFCTLHHPGHSGGNGDSFNTIIQNATSEFHIYAVDWRAERIKFYIDDNLVYTFINGADLPFNQNFFIIINCAMGGNFGGAIDPNFTSSTFEIDYVRVYK